MRRTASTKSLPTRVKGRRLPREQRGIALSAARSELFNRVLARRVLDDSWDRELDGEVWMLDGTHAIFGPQPHDEALAQRLATFDIHPTGPSWGAGELRSSGAVRELELAVIEPHALLARGLEREELSQERRALRLVARDFGHSWESPDHLVVEFGLGAGSFATTLLRELCDWHAGVA